MGLFDDETKFAVYEVSYQKKGCPVAHVDRIALSLRDRQRDFSAQPLTEVELAQGFRIAVSRFRRENRYNGVPTHRFQVKFVEILQ